MDANAKSTHDNSYHCQHIMDKKRRELRKEIRTLQKELDAVEELPEQAIVYTKEDREKDRRFLQRLKSKSLATVLEDEIKRRQENIAEHQRRLESGNLSEKEREREETLLVQEQTFLMFDANSLAELEQMESDKQGIQDLGWLAIFILLLLAIIFITGFFSLMSSSILVHQEADVELLYYAAGISLILVTHFCYQDFKNRQFSSDLRDKKEMLKTVFGIFFLVWIFFARGVPVCLHYFVAENATRVETIERKSSGYYDEFCTGGVFLLNPKYSIGRLCNVVGEKDWHELKAGDKLLLVGKESFFGFATQRYRRLSNQ